MDPPKVRVDRLIEYVAVLRGLFADGPFTYEGEHFQIDALDGTPHPHTPGGPPIFVAGGGPRMLRFAARHADIVGVNPSLPTPRNAPRPPTTASPRASTRSSPWSARRRATLRRPRPSTAGCGRAQVTDDGRGAAAEIGAALRGLDPDDVLASPFVLVGSVDEIVERLQERRERWGYSYYTVQQPAARFEFARLVSKH